MSPLRSSGKGRFAGFDVDVQAGELSRDGRKIPLEQKPFQLLTALMLRAGSLVRREELFRHLWPDDTYVVFEDSLNTAVRKLRKALRDRPGRPRFVETLARRGYRFIAPIQWLPDASPERAIAVLPLANLSSDPDQEYFADGMTEALITELGKIRSLRVVSRQSVMFYKGSTDPLPQIAEKLGVNLVVEGSVQREGSRARITVQLLNVEPEEHLWAERYDRDLRDLLGLQSEVATTIARQVEGNVVREKEEHRHGKLKSPEVHEAYLKGRFFWNQFSPAGFHKALQYFRAAIAEDASYAEAHAGLADCLAMLGWYGVLAPKDSLRPAGDAARKALELSDGVAEAHNSLAAVKDIYEWDWPGAEAEFRRAIEVNPSYVLARNWYSWYLAHRGRHDEALAQIQYARVLDPISVPTRAVLGRRFYDAGEYGRAVDELHVALELGPGFLPAKLFLAAALEEQRELAAAVAELEQAVALSSGSSVYVAALARAYAVAGQRSAAIEMLTGLEERSVHTYVSAYQMALIHAALDNEQRAFGWLDVAAEERSTWLPFLNIDPQWRQLRSRPAFLRLLTTIGSAPAGDSGARPVRSP
jgi:TolB-like protein